MRKRTTMMGDEEENSESLFHAAIYRVTANKAWKIFGDYEIDVDSKLNLTREIRRDKLWLIVAHFRETARDNIIDNKMIPEILNRIRMSPNDRRAKFA